MAVPPGVPTGPIAPGVRLRALTITPGATVYSPPLSMLWVGAAGSVTLTMAGDNVAVTLAGVPAGTMLYNLAITNIGTAAGGSLIGFY